MFRPNHVALYLSAIAHNVLEKHLLPQHSASLPAPIPRRSLPSATLYSCSTPSHFYYLPFHLHSFALSFLTPHSILALLHVHSGYLTPTFP